jgi:chromosome segregation ATPase
LRRASSDTNSLVRRGSSNTHTHKESVDNVNREVTRLSLKLDDMECDVRRLRDQGTVEHKRVALQLEDLQNQYKTQLSQQQLIKANMASECAKINAEVLKTKKVMEAARSAHEAELAPLRAEMATLKTKHKDIALKLVETTGMHKECMLDECTRYLC